MSNIIQTFVWKLILGSIFKVDNFRKEGIFNSCEILIFLIILCHFMNIRGNALVYKRYL